MNDLVAKGEISKNGRRTGRLQFGLGESICYLLRDLQVIRIGLTVHSLPSVMDGDLDHLIDALQMADQADRLSTLTEPDDPD